MPPSRQPPRPHHTGYHIAVPGRATRAEALWDYATGPAFRARVEAGMEAYAKVVELHEQDKKRTKLRWSAVEKPHVRILDAICGIAGDMQGLGGSAVVEVEAAEPLALPAADGDDDLGAFDD